jgi:hypothetical protein
VIFTRPTPGTAVAQGSTVELAIGRFDGDGIPK